MRLKSAEIIRLCKDFFHAYLVEKDNEKTLSLFCDDALTAGVYAGDRASTRVQLESYSKNIGIYLDTFSCELDWLDFEIKELDDQLGFAFADLRVRPTGGTGAGRLLRATMLAKLREDGTPGVFALHVSEPIMLIEKAVDAGTVEMIAGLNNTIKIVTDDIPGGLCVVEYDEDLTLIYANSGFYNLYEYSEYDVRVEFGNKMVAFLDAEDVVRFYDEVERSIAHNRNSFEFVTRINTHTEDVLWMRINGFVRHAGNRVLLYCMCFDVTESKDLEEELRIREELFRVALDLTTNYAYEYNIKTNSFRRSEKMRSYFGLSAGELTVEEMVSGGNVHAAHARDYVEMYRRVRGGAPFATCITRMRDAWGKYRWCRMTLKTIYDKDGHPERAIGLCEDITNQKDAEIAYSKNVSYCRNYVVGALYSFEFNLSAATIEAVSGIPEDMLKSAANNCENLIDIYIETLIYPDDREQVRRVASVRALKDSFNNGIIRVSESHRILLENGECVQVELIVNMMRDPVSGDIKSIAGVWDVEKRKHNENVERYIHKWDRRSKFLTREAAEETITEYLEGSDEQERGAFLLIHVDVSKSQRFADDARMTSKVANIIKKALSFRDVPAFVGDGRFMVLLWDVPLKEEVAERCSKICTEFAEMVDYDPNCSLQIGISKCMVGVDKLTGLYAKAFSALEEVGTTVGYRFYSDLAEDLLIDEDPFVSIEFYERMEHNKGFLPSTNEYPAKIDFKGLLDEIGEYVYICDPTTYDIVYVNRELAQDLGRDEFSCIGQKCYRLLQGLDSPCAHCDNYLLRVGEAHTAKRTYSEIGTEFMARSTMINIGKNVYRLENSVNIQDHRMDESGKLEQKPAKEWTIPECVAEMAYAPTLREAVEIAMRDLREYYGAKRVFVCTADTEDMHFSTDYLVTDVHIDETADDWQDVNMSGCTNWCASLERNFNIIIPDVEELCTTSPAEYTAYKSMGIRSIMAVPCDTAKIINPHAVRYLGIHNMTKQVGNIDYLVFISNFIAREIYKRDILNRMEYAGRHDDLTELNNRHSYLKRIQRIENSEPKSLGVLIADINGLRALNEKYGYDAGDKAIKETASILKDSFGEDVYRISDDEFVVISEDMSYADFYGKVESTKDRLSKLDGTGVSVGQAWSDLETNIEDLTKHAAELMATAKHKYYQQNNMESRRRRPQALKTLLERLHSNSFKMHLQPQVDLKTGKLVGSEALVRMYTPDGRMISPAKFVPMLEKERLIRYVDFFIFEEACKAIDQWRRSNLEVSPIAVNFSRQTLMESDLCHTLEEIASRYSIPMELIKVEITETIGEMERETLVEIGNRFRRAGFSICLDDFGTKYTNISMLSVMRFDVLKLDRSMVADLEKNPNSCIVAKHIIQMCHDMGIKIIAEGVENLDQRNLLAEMGCETGQGYLFGKPESLDSFELSWMGGCAAVH